MGHRRRNLARFLRLEASFAHPALELLVGEDPSVLGRERHVHSEERGELRRRVRRVRHHVEHEEPSALLQRPSRAAEDVHDLRRTLLVERAEDRHDVVRLRFVLVGVIVSRAALDAGLKVILCLGEMLDARKKGITNEVVSMQTKLDLEGVTEEQLKNVIIAYEPVWAIGTGLTATPEQADETCGVIRATVASLYGKKAARDLTIQYGGSMNEKNAAELLAKENVDGGLIGGASLKPAAFAAIVAAANKKA